MVEDAESDVAIRFVDENERFLLKLCQRRKLKKNRPSSLA